MNIVTKIFIGIMSLALPLAGFAGVDVIVNSSSGVTSLTPDHVKDLWNASSKTLGDNKADLCDQSADSPIRSEFYNKTTGKSRREMQALWSKIIFTGRGSEPKNAGDDAGVLACVKSSKGGIGYVASGKADSSVKTVLKLP